MGELQYDLKDSRLGNFWMKTEKTLQHHGRAILLHLRGTWWNVQHLVADRPIFVVGCSRAGTTLVYQTLSEADELGSRHRESHDFWAELHPLSDRAWESHALTKHDADDLDRETVSRYFYTETGKPRFIDKNNQNGLAVPYLSALFPDARFVYVKRSPGDNIHSLIEGWGQPKRFGTWSKDLPANVSIDDGRYSRWCFFLPQGWREYTHAPIEDVCAFQYRSMNEAIIGARQTVAAKHWTEIKYEDVVTDPVTAFDLAFDALGLRFGEQQRAHCDDILLRPYNAFSEIRLDKWRVGENRERIERVLPSVEAIAERMGYE
jgi:hypothetical protein